MEEPKNIFICPFCGHLTKIIWVHGHGQCLVCGTTIDECCRGEQASPGMDDDTTKDDHAKTQISIKHHDNEENHD